MSTEYRFNKRTGRLEGDVPRQNRSPSRGRRVASTNVGLAWISVSAIIGTRTFWFLCSNLGLFITSIEPIWNKVLDSLGFCFLGTCLLEPLAIQLFVVGISAMVFSGLSAATPIVLKWSCRRQVPYLIEGSWGTASTGLGIEVFHMMSQLKMGFLGGQLNIVEAFLLSLFTTLITFYLGHFMIERLR
jgi:hypothetical protein